MRCLSPGGLYCFNTDYDRLLRLIRLNYAVWQQYYSDRLARSYSKLDGLELYR